jgi:hypothetical protein
VTPTDEEIDEEGGWMFEVESPSADANGFKFWVWRNVSDILDAEEPDGLEEQERIVIRRKWYTIDEIRALHEC